ncbi:MAG: TIGR04282 family arsenosugar biosynthesis glycosyltransferase [Stellaceae bacterium]
MSAGPPHGDLADFCAVAVMAKAPRIGEVKTRLTPPLSEPDAAQLSGCFIRDSAENVILAARSAPLHGHVAYAPPGSEAAFRDLLPDTIQLLPSRRVGLGHSLADAARELLAAGYGSVCLVNSDSPTLPTSVLIDAARALRAPGDRVVLGPAEDGGYYCIGLKGPHARLFEQIDWSTERVLAQTLDRAREIGLDTVILPSWYDVDDLPSLRRLADELLGRAFFHTGPIRYAAPHTAAFLRRLAADDGGHRFGIALPGVPTGRARR